MYSGYFTVGGNEVGNNARTIGYQSTSDCPVSWIRDTDCSGLIEAVGGGGYVYSEIQSAPWYDPDRPELTSRFLGLYVVEMSGLSDSTRAAQITEKIVDGAQVSGYRHTSRQVRVRALLTAKGGDALEAGMTWLRNVLEPDACGVHGADCGASDFQFFVDCPPGRALIPVYSAYAEERRNLFSNPRGTSTSTTYWGTPNAGTASLITDMPLTTVTGYRYTATATTGGAVRAVAGVNMPTTSLPVHFMATVRSSFAGTVSLFARPSISSTTGQISLGTVNVVAGINYIDVTGPSFTAATTSTSGVVMLLPTVVVGNTFDVTNVLIEAGTGTYFDGAFVDTDVADYAWAGTADLSQSIYNTRDITSYTQELDDTYQVRLLDYWRLLHTVTCISGPLVQAQYTSSDKTHVAYMVEFTMLAAVPYVFSLPKEIDVPPIAPTIIEDAAFNLVPYPSAEVTSGNLTVATNYSPNPSVEVNATDWATTWNANIPAGMRSTGRVNDIAAAGTWSYRSRVLGDSGTTVITNLASDLTAQQVVPFTGLATGTRISVSIWAAAIISAGSSGSSLTNMSAKVDWLNASDVLVGTAAVGTTITTGFGGNVFSSTGLLPPATATKGRVMVTCTFVFSSSATGANNSDIRIYTDALALTVP